MALSIVAALTDTARTKLADMLSTGRSFTVNSFVVGQGGHDPGDPATALTPNPTVTTLPQQLFGPKSITSKNLTTPFCVQFICLLDDTEAVGPISNVGLLATINYSPIPGDPLVGETFLYAISNMPLQYKTHAETKTYQILVQY